MAKAKSESIQKRISAPKGTSIGNGIRKSASMNKSKKRSYKVYRGQGR